MSIAEKRVHTSKRNFIFALILLLVTNILTSVTIILMSRKTLREQINQRMLDVSNTAAYQLNGDELEQLTAEDKGSESYNRALDVLRSFQDNIELDYIYGIRAESDGTFTFTSDPAVDDPGEFGEPIKTTDALINAANGRAGVYKEAYSDDWGRFYSAYSPVFDSKGNVAGIVAVDFNAEWYDSKVNSHKLAAVILTMVAMTVGIVLSFIIMSQNRRRFSSMLKEMAELDSNMQKLDDIIMKSAVKKLDMLPESENALLKTLASGEPEKGFTHNEYDEMHTSIASVAKKLGRYLRYVDSEVHTDDTTGTLNKIAYKDKIKEFDESVSNGTAEFSVGFFDINDLKDTYVYKGFESGEQLMYECARILQELFGKKSVYHITGDEFIILAEGKGRLDMDELFDRFDKAINSYNSREDTAGHFSVAKGASTYTAEKHSCYRDVFVEEKLRCDEDKAAFYKRRS